MVRGKVSSNKKNNKFITVQIQYEKLKKIAFEIQGKSISNKVTYLDNLFGLYITEE